MKRNKHHGLNVEFDGLCMDFGHVSLNKKKEFLCGDCYKIEENDEDLDVEREIDPCSGAF